MVYLTIIIIFILILIILINGCKPLNESEINKYATYLRNKEINEYFNFHKEIPKPYKRKFSSKKPLVDPSGQLIKIKIPFHYAPACISYWLKYKKHQWFIAIYCSDKSNFELLYGNKGLDNKTVLNYFGEENLFEDKMRNKFSTILLFHNHPMSIYGNPDQMDISNGKSRAELAEIMNWNYIEFLCVRGEYKKFSEFYSSKFKSIEYYKSQFLVIHKAEALNNLKFRWTTLSKI